MKNNDQQLPMPTSPDWSTAPDWAQWFAVDYDGEGYYFECQPIESVYGVYGPQFKGNTQTKCRKTNGKYVPGIVLKRP